MVYVCNVCELSYSIKDRYLDRWEVKTVGTGQGAQAAARQACGAPLAAGTGQLLDLPAVPESAADAPCSDHVLGGARETLYACEQFSGLILG